MVGALEPGSPPASWFIDDLLEYLGQSYYVGLLSAAEIHTEFSVELHGPSPLEY